MYENIKGKKLLILGGTRISCDIVNQAQKMGLYVCVADYNTKDKSPCKQICDEDFLVSCTDVDAVVELIHREKIDGVITGFSDMLLPYYASICQKSGCYCYGNKQLFDILTDKIAYKKLCRKYGIPVIEDYQVNEDNISSLNIVYPVLFKPSDDSGSRGLRICNDKDTLLKTIMEYKESGKDKYLVERYVDTDEVMVHIVVENGNCHLASVANRHVKHINGNSYIPALVGFTMPSSILSSYNRITFPKVKNMLKDLGVQNGLLFMQCKIIDGICCVFDIGYRLTGSLEYHIIEKMCGYSSLKMLIHFALTGSMLYKENIDINPFLKKIGFSVVKQVSIGTIGKINGVNKVLALPFITNVFEAHKVSEEIKPQALGTLQQVQYRIHGVVDNEDDLNEAISEIDNILYVESIEGKSMFLEGMTKEDYEGRIVVSQV